MIITALIMGGIVCCTLIITCGIVIADKHRMYHEKESMLLKQQHEIDTYEARLRGSK